MSLTYGSWFPGQFRSFSLSRDLSVDEERLSLFNAFQTGDKDRVEPTQGGPADIGSENGYSALCMDFQTNVMGRQKKRGCQTLGTPAFVGCLRITQESDN